MINRRSLLIALAAMPASALAQSRRHRIGWLVFGGTTLGVIDQTLLSSLAQRGFVNGNNIDVVFRYADGIPSQLAELSRELVQQKPDLLIGVGGDVVRALFLASGGAIPIVGGISDNPVRAQVAESLAHPGKNFTGVTFLTDEMAAKRMELLKEASPSIRRVAVIFNPQHLDDEMTFARRGAVALDVGLTTHPLNSIADVDATLRDVGVSGADGIFVIPSRVTVLAAAKISQYSREQRLPMISAWREFAENGGLLSYGPNRVFEARRISGYAEKVLNGAKPADLPVEQPTRFELVVNLKTAGALGITIPSSILLRADEVIE